MTLKEQLEERKVSFSQKADAYTKKIYKEGIDAVVDDGIVNQAKQVGDQAPSFSLTNASGQSVSLSEYLEKGKVVLTWYRGGWCPYCNMTLKELQNELANYQSTGANLLALTPELPDHSISTKEKNNLSFEVLSDVGNQVAKEYGIVFELIEPVAEKYNAGFALNEHNGDQSNELPLAATYVIEQDGTISYAFLDADYRNRAEPSEIINHL